MIRFALFCYLMTIVIDSLAVNDHREQEFAEQIESSLTIGSVVKLKAGKKTFLALYTETENKKTSGTAIIVHPQGGHPDQKKIIKPLRHYLPAHNWATLAIQMPVLSPGAGEEEYFPFFEQANERLKASVDLLTTGGVNNIALVGYGLGSMMALYHISQNPETRIKAVVAISLGVPDSQRKEAQVLQFLGQIKFPVFDIYAENDLAYVVDNARKKKVASKDNQFYRQLELAGEGYLFEHDEGLAVKRIYSWLSRTFRSLEEVAE